MKKFHHLGIPVDIKLKEHQLTGESYMEGMKTTYYTGDRNPYGMYWVRYDDDSGYSDFIKKQTYVCFEVDSLDDYIKTETVVVEPEEVIPGLTRAFIDVLGCPVQLLQFDRQTCGDLLSNPVEASGKNLIYHHSGLPSDGHWENETKVEHLKLAYLPGKYNAWGVEWLRFEEGNENPDIIKYIPHAAFEVEDIDQAIVGEKVVYHSGREHPGIIVVMIEINGTTVEFLELDRSIVGDEFDSGQ